MQRLHPADAEHDFLSHPHLEIAAVKFGGDEAVLRAILRDIGIEEIEIDSTDMEPPDFGGFLKACPAPFFPEGSFRASYC